MRTLKNKLIPYKGNQYTPHAIRRKGLLVFAVLILALQGIHNYQTTGAFQVLGYSTNVSINDLVSGTNAERDANGLRALSLNSQLTLAAQAKADHMIANDYWAHYAPDGTSPWFFMAQAGYTYDRAGENLAYSFATSAGAIAGWMNSPSHRANILDVGFQEIGFGIANGANYQGGENTVIVAMYGQPFTPIVAAEASPQLPAALADQLTSAPAVEPAAEPSPEPPQANDEPVPVSLPASQRLLASLDADGTLLVSGESQGVTSQDSRVTTFSTLVSGHAHWSLYLLSGTLLSLAAIYLVRHTQAIYQIVRHGEHFVAGHPTIEASLVYVVIWAVLFASYGVIQ